MLYSHRPQGRIGSIRPVNSSMEHHGPGNGHDCSDGSLCLGIVVVGTNTCKLADLLELAKFCGELSTGKGCTIVRQVGARNHSMASTELLIGLLAFQGLMASEKALEVDPDMISGTVNKEATSLVLGLDRATPFGLKGMTTGAADEVINRCLLSWEQLLSRDDSLSVLDDGTSCARGWSGRLFAKLAGCTLGSGSQL